MSPGGVKCVIMGEEVCTDKLKEKGGKRESSVKSLWFRRERERRTLPQRAQLQELPSPG